MDDPHHAEPGGRTHPPSELLVSASAIGIMAVDEEGVIRSCNPAAVHLLGRPADHLVGRALGYPTLVDETREIDLTLPDGTTRTVEMRVSATTWDGQRLFITALHEATRSEPSLHHTVQRQSLLIAATAQELENPLITITEAVHQFRRDTDGSEEHRAELLDRIDEHTQYLRAFARRLHAATRLDPAREPAITEPVRVFELLLERLHELRERSRDFRLFCDAGTVVFVDRDDFRHMLDNYLDNALTQARPPADLRVTRHGDWVILCVCTHQADTPGQSAPQRGERSAEPVTQPGEEPGLWIIRGLAQANGGDAWHATGQSHGTYFYLRLPATPPARR